MESAVKRFGVTIVGEPIEWGFINDQGELEEVYVHPKVGIEFHEIIAYQNLRQRILYENRKKAEAMKGKIEGIDREDPSMVMKLAEVLGETSEEDESRLFRMQVDSLLMLVADRDLQTVEPLFRKAHPNDVRDLIEHFQRIVVTKTQESVESAGHVDPTLLPPPADSSPPDDSGEDSASTESTSTA